MMRSDEILAGNDPNLLEIGDMWSLNHEHMLYNFLLAIPEVVFRVDSSIAPLTYEVLNYNTEIRNIMVQSRASTRGLYGILMETFFRRTFSVLHR